MTDDEVLALLSDNPREFQDLFTESGMERAELAHALRRLHNQGRAGIIHGKGWRALPRKESS